MATWTVARQAPLSIGLSQARILVWIAISFQEDLPDTGIEHESLASPLAGGVFAAETPGKPLLQIISNP